MRTYLNTNLKNCKISIIVIFLIKKGSNGEKGEKGDRGRQGRKGIKGDRGQLIQKQKLSNKLNLRIKIGFDGIDRFIPEGGTQ